MKPEMIEGPQAFKKFENAMKAAFRVPKTKVVDAEKKYKLARKRKKS